MAKKKEWSDEELVEGIIQDSDDALRFIYRQYFPMINYFIIKNNGDEHEAKDIFQDTVVVLFENIRAGKFELRSKIKTYLYSVSRRLWLKRLTELGRSISRIDELEEFLVFEEEAIAFEEAEEKFGIMKQALQLLGEPCRGIIEAFYINNLSMQEITDKFGYTNTDNTKNQKYKCFNRLKKLFFTNFTGNGNR